MLSTSKANEVAVVLAAHGSSQDVRINMPLFGLAESVAGSGQFAMVTPAFLDGQPSIEWVLDEIQQPNVIVIPFMTSRGYYSDVIFPKHLQSISKNVVFTQPIGTQPQLVELVNRQLTLSLASISCRDTVSVIVIGHGTRRNKRSCLTTIQLVKSLRAMRPELDLKFAFLDQRPELDHVFERTLNPNVILVPFLMGLGPHLTYDIPNAFGSDDLTEAILCDSDRFPIDWQTEVQSEFQSVRQDIRLTRPVGIYPDWSTICVELANEFLQQEVAA